MVRVLTAAILLPALWATIKVAPPALFSAAALAAIGLAVWECLGMFDGATGRPFKTVGMLAALALVWSFLGHAPRFGPLLPLTALVLAAVLQGMALRREPQEMMSSVLHTLFPVLFVGLGLSYVAGLRAMPGEDGEDLLMLVFVCVIFADTAAYYVGSWIGRRRLAPVVSPNKSWEGALAGVAASLLGAWIVQLWVYRRLPLGHALTLGVALGVVAVLGDLAESMVKRSARVKDASRLLPGHGGVLDRTDSLVFAGPLLYYYYHWFLQAPS